MDTFLDIGGLLGIAIGVAGVVVLVSNRRIKDERAQFVEKQRDDYREALELERADCKRQLNEQGERISRLEGQLEAATGDLGDRLGERIGQRIGTAILGRLGEKGIG